MECNKIWEVTNGDQVWSSYQFWFRNCANSKMLDTLILNDKSMCLGNIQNSRYQIISFQHIKTN